MLSNGSKNELISENAVILVYRYRSCSLLFSFAERGLFFRPAFYLQDFRVIS